jgi:predicted ATPase/DNA-binding SARP family transcriptional activator/uncharacterized protein HemY
METLRITLLGHPTFSLNEAPLTNFRYSKAQALLCYLAVTGRPHARSALVGLLWGDLPEAKARTNLRRVLVTLRRQVGSHLLITRQTVALNQESPYWLDVAEFEAKVGSAATESDITRLSEGLELYQGDFLEGFYVPNAPEFEAWLLAEQGRLRELALQGLHTLARHYTEQGHLTQGIDYTRQLLSMEPWREEAHRQLMLLLARNGQRGAALAQYDVCRGLLAEELDVEPAAETTALYERIRAGDQPFQQASLEASGEISPAQSVQPLAPRHNLPPQPTAFIGRDKELAELGRLIREEPACRLLTLVGPGGIGKTRLALQAAADALETFADGVYFVSLAPVSAVKFIAPTMAEALAFPLYGQADPQEQLLNYLREKEMLLVLDNLEHLLTSPGERTEGGVGLLAQILVTAPQVKLLVTSRERLKLRREWVFTLAGLEVPQRDEVEDVETYSAVQLFLQQARQVQQDLGREPVEWASIVRICRLVGGMPLGIELAAAWAAVLPVTEMAAEIERNFDFLASSMRDLPERHRSLRAVFEHSWRLLSEEERSVFRKVSVFRGSFSRSAAEEVAGASLHRLSTLVDKSLLRPTRAGRYELHELLRQFAAEKLQEVSGASEQVQDRHADYYAGFLHQQEADLRGSRQPEALEEIAAEIDNVWAGWRWAVQREKVETIGQALDSLYFFSEIRGRFYEGEEAFRQAMESLGKTRIQNLATETQTKFKIVLGRLLRGQGWFCTRLGLLEQDRELLQQSVSRLRQCGPDARQELALSLWLLGVATYYHEDYRQAKQHFQESLSIFTEVGDRWGRGYVLLVLGQVAELQGVYAEAEPLLQESIGISKEISDRRTRSFALNALGRVACVVGEYPQAERHLEESLKLRQELGDLAGIGFSLRDLGNLARARGQYQQANQRLQESLAIFKKIGSRNYTAAALTYLGAVARLLGEYEQAEQYLGESLALAKEIGYQRNIVLCLNNLGRLAYDRGAYRQAEQFLQESQAICERIGYQAEMVSALRDLGYVACAAGKARREESREQFQKALKIAIRIGAKPLALDVLVGLATLLTVGEPEDAGRTRAVELLALVLDHPASKQDTKETASRLLAELDVQLSPQAGASARKRGQTRELEEVVAGIMGIFVG